MIPPSPKSVLSIDFGSKRIGLAGCDPLGISVTPLKPLYKGKFRSDLKYLRQLCKERSVEGLVIGLPLDDKGNPTLQSHICMKYGTRIAIELDLPVAWVNENSSTWEAGKKFNIQNDRTGMLDSQTARILLEQWLKEGPNLQSLSTQSKINSMNKNP